MGPRRLVRKARLGRSAGGLLAIAVVLPLAAFTLPSSDAPPATFTVQGNEIRYGGQPFQPRGFSMIAALSPLAELSASCPGATQPSADRSAAASFSSAELIWLRDHWHANTVRLQLSQTALTGSFAGDYVTVVAADVQLAESAGLKVILSMQDQGTLSCADGNQMPSQATEDAWANLLTSDTSLSTDGSVMLELFNEPVDDSTKPQSGKPLPAADWDQWLDGGVTDLQGVTEVGHEQLLQYLRGLGATNLLIADGLNAAGVLPGPHQGALLTDSENRLAYGVHPYFFTQGASDWNYRFGDLAATEPVIATEWNYPVSACGTAAQQDAPAFLAYLNAHDIGALGYSGDYPINPPLLLVPGQSPTPSPTPTLCPGTLSSGPGIDFLDYLATAPQFPPPPPPPPPPAVPVGVVERLPGSTVQVTVATRSASPASTAAAASGLGSLTFGVPARF